MAISEGKRLAEFSRAVRESTLKRLRAVPRGKENWRITPNAMSFADHAQHLIDYDEGLFRMLEAKELEPLVGFAGVASIDRRAQYRQILAELARIGERRAALLEGLTARDLDAKVRDERFGDKVTLWWVIVRGNLDHEIHHRGQVAACLRAVKGKG